MAGAVDRADPELAAAYVQAVEDRVPDAFETVQGGFAILVYLAMGALVTGFTQIPALKPIFKVGLWPVAVVVGSNELIFISQAWLVKRFGAGSRVMEVHQWIDTFATIGSGVWLVWLSGSATSIWWSIVVAQVLVTGKRVKLKRLNFVVLIGLCLALAAAFGLAGQRGDMWVSVMLTVVTSYILWVMVSDEEKATWLQAEKDLLERRLTTLEVERERERIARDLHDGLGAELTGLVLRARRATADANTAQLAAADEVIGDARRILDELRDVVWNLGPDGARWAELVDRVRRKGGDLFGDEVAFDVVDAGCPEGFRIPEGLGTHPLRMVQELLRNARTHARARRVTVALAADTEALRITVADDGVGLDPEAAVASAGGLAHLRARAQSLGGTVTVTGGEGGARVDVVLPLPSADGVRLEPAV